MHDREKVKKKLRGETERRGKERKGKERKGKEREEIGNQYWKQKVYEVKKKREKVSLFFWVFLFLRYENDYKW